MVTWQAGILVWQEVCWPGTQASLEWQSGILVWQVWQEGVSTKTTICCLSTGNTLGLVSVWQEADGEVILHQMWIPDREIMSFNMFLLSTKTISWKLSISYLWKYLYLYMYFLVFCILYMLVWYVLVFVLEFVFRLVYICAMWIELPRYYLSPLYLYWVWYMGQCVRESGGGRCPPIISEDASFYSRLWTWWGRKLKQNGRHWQFKKKMIVHHI